MRARQVSEDEAFRLLRTASMHGNQRVGQVSRQVIDAAQVAEAINRAGQQRVVKQALLAAAGAGAKNTPAGAAAAPQAALAMSATAQAFELGMAMLTQAPLSTSEIRATLVAAQVAWASLRDAVARTQEPAGRLQVAVASEDLLDLFDRLTGAYQHSMQVLMG